MSKTVLNNKKILIVDDEPDVLESLSELLDMCSLSKAATYEEAAHLLETQTFDFAVLDIMGVKGYDLLELAQKKGVTTVMLTANALSVEDTVKSFKNGAVSYIPKDKMTEIETYLADILENREKDSGFIDRWLQCFDSYYQKKFGSDWKDKDKNFWEKHGYWL